MPNNNNRVKYTRGHIEYILNNYRALGLAIQLLLF